MSGAGRLTTRVPLAGGANAVIQTRALPRGPAVTNPDNLVGYNDPYSALAAIDGVTTDQTARDQGLWLPKFGRIR